MIHLFLFMTNFLYHSLLKFFHHILFLYRTSFVRFETFFLRSDENDIEKNILKQMENSQTVKIA